MVCARDFSHTIIAERGDLFGWDSGDRIDVNMDVGHKAMCGISTLLVNGNVWAKLSARACPFTKLQRAWRQADQSPFASRMLRSNWRMHRSSIPSISMIALDRGTPFEPQAPELRVRNVVGLGTEEHQHNFAIWITEQHGAEDLQVFLPGRSQVGDATVDCYCLSETTSNITNWHRVGICMWLTSHLSDPDGGTIAFHFFPKPTQQKDTFLSNAILLNPKVPYETRYQKHYHQS